MLPGMWSALRAIAPRIPFAPRGRSASDQVAVATDVEPLVQLTVTLRSVDLPPFRSALADRLGEDSVGDSPRRLEDAVDRLVRAAGGTATVEVRRSPGAMRMPEVWTVRLTAADAGALAAIQGLGR